MLFAIILSIALGTEARSEPTIVVRQPDYCGAAALASVGDTIFLAWPAVRDGQFGIVATLLDQQLTELPVQRMFLPQETAPLCLSAASNGNDIMLVWSTAIDARTHQAWGVLFRRDLSIMHPPTQLPAMETNSRPGIAWQVGAGRYLVVTGPKYLEIRPRGRSTR